MANPTDYLLGYWELDDATDAHTGGHDLTESGTVTYTAGEGADLGTSNGYLRIPVADAGAFQLGTDSQTWHFEFKFDAVPAAGSVPIVMFGYDGDPGLQDGWGVLLNTASTILFRFSDGTTQAAFTATGTYTTGTWYKCAIVMDRKGFMRGYINNALVGSVSISTYSTTSLSSPLDLVFGGELATRYFDGRVRRVAAFAGVMSGYVRNRLVAGDDYADLSAITAAYPAQEFVAIGTGSNVVAQSVGVSDLVEGQVALVLQSIDGNSTSHTLTAWDGAWSQIIDEVATQLGTAFCRLRGWWKVVTATDVSSVTQAATAWSSSQEATLIVQLWDNCVGVNIDGATANTATSTSHTAPAVTTTVDGCTILGVLAVDAATVISSTDTDLTRSGEDGRNGSGSVVVWHGTQFQATAGSTGTYSFTTTDPESAIAATIAMEPAAGGDVTGSGTITDGGETLAGEGDVIVAASGTLTDGGETLAGEGDVIVAASGTITDAGETLTGSGAVIVAASGSVTDGGETLAGVVGVLGTVEASGSITDGGEVLAGTGTVVANPIAFVTGTAQVYARVSGTAYTGARVSGTVHINPTA